MRILIIEDDKNIRNFLVQGLQSETYTVDIAEDGEAGSFSARTNDYDLIILDLILPKKDGDQVCREIRQSGRTSPILLLSVNATVGKKVSLLNCGVDDYLTKPFSFKELEARVRALLRRPRPIEPDILEVGDLKIDIPKQKVVRGSMEVYLTRKEFSLLEYLIRNRGNVVSRGMIMEHVWNADCDPFSNTIEAHILNIRKKIHHPRKQRLIHTVPGRGYKIERV